MPRNIAYIDGQNLYMGTKSALPSWEVDLVRFRRYLAEKYHVADAYYFLGYVQNENEELYDMIQKAGFILKFREHTAAMQGTKKGNVDSDIIFLAMKKLYRGEQFDRVVLVSGDGDYMQLVEFLIEEKRFEKILFPNKKYASSLYKKISRQYFVHLEDVDVQRKIKRGP